MTPTRLLLEKLPGFIDAYIPIMLRHHQALLEDAVSHAAGSPGHKQDLRKLKDTQFRMIEELIEASCKNNSSRYVNINFIPFLKSMTEEIYDRNDTLNNMRLLRSAVEREMEKKTCEPCPGEIVPALWRGLARQYGNFVSNYIDRINLTRYVAVAVHPGGSHFDYSYTLETMEDFFRPLNPIDTEIEMTRKPKITFLFYSANIDRLGEHVRKVRDTAGITKRSNKGDAAAFFSIAMDSTREGVETKLHYERPETLKILKTG